VQTGEGTAKSFTCNLATTKLHTQKQCSFGPPYSSSSN